MSIANELSRLLQAKSDLATSIANKGVTVPAATTIDGYAALVDQIQQGGGGTLPYDAEIEYIESTGTQYIYTGIKLNMYNTIIDSSYYLTANNKFLYLARLNATSYFWGLYSNRADYGVNNGGQINISEISTNVWHNIEDASNGLWIDGTKILTRTPISKTTDGQLLIFASYNNGSISMGSFRLKKFKVTTNSNILVDYIPVRKGQIGYLYDKVSGQLFCNAGTGSFTLGPDVT